MGSQPGERRNTVDHAAIINALHAPALVGQDAFDKRPFKVAHI